MIPDSPGVDKTLHVVAQRTFIDQVGLQFIGGCFELDCPLLSRLHSPSHQSLLKLIQLREENLSLDGARLVSDGVPDVVLRVVLCKLTELLPLAAALSVGEFRRK